MLLLFVFFILKASWILCSASSWVCPFKVFGCCFALSLGFVKQEALHIQSQPFSYRYRFHGEDRLFIASDLARFLIILQTVLFSPEQQAPCATCLHLQVCLSFAMIFFRVCCEIRHNEH